MEIRNNKWNISSTDKQIYHIFDYLLFHEMRDEISEEHRDDILQWVKKWIN